MERTWRLVLFIYNLLLLSLAGAAVFAAAGRPEPLEYIKLGLSTPQNRVVVGTLAILLAVIALLLLFAGLKPSSSVKRNDSIIINSELNGEVSITVPAIKLIIMKAVKKVEGIKDIKPAVSSNEDGLVIYLHMMINPEHNVPEMSKNLQQVVKQYLEEIGGLQVSQVKVLVDDFNVANRPAGN
ncbi:MAG: alkaline shock response membrane anchor protein AmaP [Syntrophomonas sp.]